MKILFVARHFAYFRNYDSVLRLLASRGHRIHLAVEKSEASGGQALVEVLARECPSITYGPVASRDDERWGDLSRRLRLGLDHLRYLDSFYDDAPLRRVRAEERTPRALAALASPRFGGSAWWRSQVGAVLHQLDRAIPVPPGITRFLEEQRPDVLLITPLVDLGSQQIDFLRAARLLGVPTALAVQSWDHLSSKAYLREYPERVLVWNDTQRREAVQVHGVPADRVTVTGAQCFDHWFDRQPSRSRAELCAQLGLPVDRPIVLYVCTGLIMGSPPEPPFVRRWLGDVRSSSDPRVSTAGVLIRPHPSFTEGWRNEDLSALGPVAVWGGNPIDQQSRADYFDSLYHSAAVVGLNTSAFIEAGIVGREVLAILPPEFHDNQRGTVHFRYLVEIGGGLLRLGRTLDEHLSQLALALSRPAGDDHPHRAFLESFVRPRGLSVPATPVFVDAVEALAGCRVAEADVTAAPGWARTVAEHLRRWTRDPRAERWVLSPREIERLTRVRGAAEAKAARRDDAARAKAAGGQERLT